jgi:hypothetical protein
VFANPANLFDPTGLDGWTRVWGGARAIGGGFETAAGVGLAVATGWTGVGAVAGGAVGLHGLDQIQAGLRQLFTGCKTDSLTSTGLQAVGLSQSAANLVDAGISVVGSLGAGVGATASRAVGLANVPNYEVGMATLSPDKWAKYGQIADPVERGAQMLKDLGPRALIDPSGSFSKTIWMGGTPLANGAMGAAGAAAAAGRSCACKN